MPHTETRPAHASFARILAITALGIHENESHQRIAEKYYRGRADPARALEIVQRAAVSIADRTTTGWAAELVGTIVAEFQNGLRPLSAFQRLRDMGPRFDIAGGPISVPGRLPNTGHSGAAWVGESGAIPVVQGKIGAGTLWPRKVAAIAPFTNELARSSVSQVERVLQSIILADLAELIDASLTDDAAASEIRPGGLLDGVTTIPSVNAATDLAALAAAMTAAKAQLPALILHPERLNGLWSDPAYGPNLPGRLGPFALVPSYYVSDPGRLVAVDAASFASGMAVPIVTAAPSATLTMANADATAPTQAITAGGTIGLEGEVPPDGGIPVAGGPVGAGTANIVAMSMFQQNATALRVVAPLAWAMTRPDAVAAVDGATW